MEPMTLGSPVNSPPHHGYQQHQGQQYPYSQLGLLSPTSGVGQMSTGSLAHQQAQHHPQTPTTPGAASTQGQQQTPFLPGFLMGDYTQQGAGRMVSPTKLNRSLSSQSQTGGGPGGANGHSVVGGGTHLVGTPGTPVPSGSRVNGFLTPTTPAATSGTPLRSHASAADKPGGPPIKGLFSTPGGGVDRGGGLMRGVLESTSSGSQVSSPALSGGAPRALSSGTPMPSTPGGFSLAGGTPKTFNNTALDHSLSTSHSDGPSSSTWVTVFGFPPSAASYILKQFSQCGTVLQHHVPSSGNWMNIRFQTRTQAQSALGRSGRVLGGTLMIGVTPTTEAEVQALANGTDGLLDRTSGGSALNSSVNASFTGTPSGHNRSIRPLAQAYKAAQSEHELSMNSTTTSKNDGLVTRAMGCIFGW